MGYKNLNRGMRRIINLEREGRVYSEILRKIIYALKLNEDIINELIRKDREAYEEDYERWLNEPISMYYTVRVMPAIYLSYDLPSYIKTVDETIDYASAIAKDEKKLVWLSPSRKIIIFINKEGEVIGRKEVTYDDIELPYMKIR